MKIAIAGFDVEGRSSYAFFLALGHELTILDQNENIVVPAGANTVLGPAYLADLNRFDLIIRTAGLPPRRLFAANPKLSPDKVSTQVNEFLRICPTTHTIGVTGTKGKGTTSTLIAQMLRATGFDVQLAGNIGVPALDILGALTSESWVVLELSSFQLIDLQNSPSVGVCLMVVPEHLNWHADMAEYVAAKSQLFAHQNSSDVAIYYAENSVSRTIASTGLGQKLPYYASPGAYVIDDTITIGGSVICQTSELKLLGAHNWQNVCAALTVVWQITQDLATLQSVLRGFTGLPFRIEPRQEVNGIRYFNDSFASGGDACIAALKAVPGMKVMIIGGYDRGLDLNEYASKLKDEAEGLRKIVLIGQSATRMAHNLDLAGFGNYVVSEDNDMSAIIHSATAFAEVGDAVVLSPGFASFDMFKNFEDRGIKFNQAVSAL